MAIHHQTITRDSAKIAVILNSLPSRYGLHIIDEIHRRATAVSEVIEDDLCHVSVFEKNGRCLVVANTYIEAAVESTWSMNYPARDAFDASPPEARSIRNRIGAYASAGTGSLWPAAGQFLYWLISGISGWSRLALPRH